MTPPPEAQRRRSASHDRILRPHRLDGATVTYATGPTDNVGVTTASRIPTSGSTFPLGTTTVMCTAIDSAGNSGVGSFDVTIEVNPSVDILLRGIESLAERRGVEESLKAPLRQVDDLINDSKHDNETGRAGHVGRRR